MSQAVTLERRLAGISDAAPMLRAAVETAAALVAASEELSALVARGALIGASPVGSRGGDAQEIMMRHLREAPVAAIASARLNDWILLDADKPMAVAFDPLDGSASLDAHMPLGTIFSVLPASGAASPFTSPGSAQIAAGLVVYGRQTTLALTLGAGVDIFTLDPRERIWRLTCGQIRIPDSAAEYAIDASRDQHWEAPARLYADERRAGGEGPRAKNFDRRWIGSLPAAACRILDRGGVFLDPADQREGRAHLLCEAHPIAFVMSQAGGLASTGHARILELSAQSIHQRAPLIFGAGDDVRRIEGLHAAPDGRADAPPLFGRRGLFRC